MSLANEARAELIWRRCRKDPVFFFENYWHIRHPQGRRLFELRDAQKEVLQDWVDGEFSICLKARQIGWSTLVSAFQFWKAFFFQDQGILDISKGEREAGELLNKSRFGYNLLPDWMRAKGPRLVSDTQQLMSFDNGSEIRSLPSASNPARSFTGTLIVCDEFAFLQDPDEAWASIEPAADIGGQIIILSTANGVGNMFYTLWMKARRGENHFKPRFYSWAAVPERDENWYEAKCASMLPWQRAQEFPTTEREAFVQSGRPVFDDMLLSAQSPIGGDRGYLHVTGLKSSEFREQVDGVLEVWQYPQIDGVYVIGADVAEGLEHGDASSAHVVDVRDGSVVAHWHGRCDPDIFADELYRLGHFYNYALVAPEANNHGIAVCLGLRRLGYGKLYRRRQVDTSTRKVEVKYGWLTTRVSKPLVIDDLIMAMRHDQVSIPCQRTLDELQAYVRDEKGAMSGSPHDDRDRKSVV